MSTANLKWESAQSLRPAVKLSEDALVAMDALTSNSGQELRDWIPFFSVTDEMKQLVDQMPSISNDLAASTAPMLSSSQMNSGRFHGPASLPSAQPTVNTGDTFPCQMDSAAHERPLSLAVRSMQIHLAHHCGVKLGQGLVRICRRIWPTCCD